jgi:hypothetical protein
MLAQAARPGDTELIVSSSVGFHAGGQITIAGGGNQETAVVAGFGSGSIVLVQPLIHSFPMGSTVSGFVIPPTYVAEYDTNVLGPSADPSCDTEPQHPLPSGMCGSGVGDNAIAACVEKCNNWGPDCIGFVTHPSGGALRIRSSSDIDACKRTRYGFKWHQKHTPQQFDPSTQYVLENVFSEGKFLEVGGFQTADGSNVQLWEDVGQLSAQWTFEEISTGIYTIENVHAPGKHLQVANNGANDGANVHLHSDVGSESTHWQIAPLAYGVYTIENVHAPG